jgi:hypothetical protein
MNLRLPPGQVATNNPDDGSRLVAWDGLSVWQS